MATIMILVCKTKERLLDILSQQKNIPAEINLQFQNIIEGPQYSYSIASILSHDDRHIICCDFIPLLSKQIIYVYQFQSSKYDHNEAFKLIDSHCNHYQSFISE